MRDVLFSIKSTSASRFLTLNSLVSNRESSNNPLSSNVVQKSRHILAEVAAKLTNPSAALKTPIGAAVG